MGRVLYSRKAKDMYICTKQHCSLEIYHKALRALFDWINPNRIRSPHDSQRLIPYVYVIIINCTI